MRTISRSVCGCKTQEEARKGLNSLLEWICELGEGVVESKIYPTQFGWNVEVKTQYEKR